MCEIVDLRLYAGFVSVPCENNLLLHDNVELTGEKCVVSPSPPHVLMTSFILSSNSVFHVNCISKFLSHDTVHHSVSVILAFNVLYKVLNIIGGGLSFDEFS